jgi:hypothetical protein
MMVVDSETLILILLALGGVFRLYASGRRYQARVVAKTKGIMENANGHL